MIQPMHAMHVDLRIDAGWIVPVEPAGALAGHALIVDGGPHRRARADRRAPTRDYAAREHVVLPRHVLMPGPRQRAHARGDDAVARHRRRRAAEALARASTSGRAKRAFVAPEFVHDGTLLAAAEMLRGGITCCNDMYFFPEPRRARASSSRHARDARACRCSTSRRPTPPMPTRYLQRGLAARDAFKHAPRLVVRAGAARALHGRRRDVEQDRDVRAPARPADPDASRRDARPRSTTRAPRPA